MKYEEEWDYTIAKIREILKEKKWSMSRLGDEIGTDPSNMCKMLSSKKQRDTRYSTLFKIADALGVKMSELVR